MEFIGQYLKKQRLEKKLNLKKISKELMISHNLLKDIENDFFPDYLDIVFIIGHIRTYSKYLNLDSNSIINQFKIQISYHNVGPLKEISKPINSRNIINLPKSFSFALFFIVSFSFYYLFIDNNKQDYNFAMTPDLPENLQYSLEKTSMNLSLKKLSSIDQKNIDNLENHNPIFKKILNKEKKSISSSSVIASQKKISRSDLDQVTLKFLNPTWIQLKDNDKKIIISKLMNQGDEYIYSLSNKYSLTAGNAGNIIILINGNVRGKAGKAGEVLEALIVNSNFNN
jgi:cytoskeletal protein RodZ